jgi:pseudaminic acid biosynthesis-associated methylase
VQEPEASSEARRLEELWSGEFGDEYVDRNLDAHRVRESFWKAQLDRCGARSVLEVGCNIGANLRWIADVLGPGAAHGIDVNRKALSILHAERPDIDAVWSQARDIPFRDRRFDLVFTMGVLIHQPDATLPLVMNEMVRCSRRWVLCGEYYAPESEEVPYRGHAGALFRRDYGSLFVQLFPELGLRESGFLGRDEGWDDITWWLFERP